MENRINVLEKGQNAVKALYSLGSYLMKSPIEQRLLNLIYYRVSKISGGNVPDEVYEETRKQFTEEEIVDLTIAVIAINSYNRINIAFRTTAGTYQPSLEAIEAKKR